MAAVGSGVDAMVHSGAELISSISFPSSTCDFQEVHRYVYGRAIIESAEYGVVKAVPVWQ